MKGLALALTCTALLLSGCSGTTVRAIGPDHPESKNRGFRYYESSPYLLVYSDGNGGLISKLIYLPDQTRLRSIRPWEFLASNTGNLKFSNGVLNEAKLEGDGTALPKAVIEGLQGLAEAAVSKIGFRIVEDDLFAVPVPILFKVVFDAGGNASLMQAKSIESEMRVRPGIAEFE